MRVVLDTNVLVSALIAHRPGAASFVYDRALNRAFVLVSSPALIRELARKLRGKFRWDEGAIGSVVRDLASVARRQNALVQPSRRVQVVRDEDDNRVLEAAEAGRANLVVSGDLDLLDLQQHEGIPIIRLADFARTLGHQAVVE